MRILPEFSIIKQYTNPLLLQFDKQQLAIIALLLKFFKDR